MVRSFCRRLKVLIMRSKTKQLIKKPLIIKHIHLLLLTKNKNLIVAQTPHPLENLTTCLSIKTTAKNVFLTTFHPSKSVLVLLDH